MARVLRQGDSPKLLGAPLRGVRILVVTDPEMSQAEVSLACRGAVTHPSELPAGVEGELVAVGVQVAGGYVGQKDLSHSSKFGVATGEGTIGTHPGGQANARAERFYRSGDLVKAGDEGLVYVGRADLQVKVQGVRCEVGEIEFVLRSSAIVEEAVVLVDEEKKTHTEAVVLLHPLVAPVAGCLVAPTRPLNPKP